MRDHDDALKDIENRTSGTQDFNIHTPEKEADKPLMLEDGEVSPRDHGEDRKRPASHTPMGSSGPKSPYSRWLTAKSEGGSTIARTAKERERESS